MGEGGALQKGTKNKLQKATLLSKQISSLGVQVGRYHDRASQIAAVLQHTAGKVLKTCKIDNTIGIWSTTIVGSRNNNALVYELDELFYNVDNRCVVYV